MGVPSIKASRIIPALKHEDYNRDTAGVRGTLAQNLSQKGLDIPKIVCHHKCVKISTRPMPSAKGWSHRGGNPDGQPRETPSEHVP